jgi:hypothetical protein
MASARDGLSSCIARHLSPPEGSTPRISSRNAQAGMTFDPIDWSEDQAELPFEE